GRIACARDVAIARVDCTNDVRCGLEARHLQAEQHSGALVEVAFDLALNGGAVRNAARRRGVHGDARAAGTVRSHAAYHQIALRQRINLSIGATQWRQQQGAAAQTLGITHRGYCDVDALSLAITGRERCAHHHRRDVAQSRMVILGDLHPELLQHVRHGLTGELHLRPVAGALQADDQPVADELVLPYAFHVHERTQRLDVACRPGDGGRRVYSRAYESRDQSDQEMALSHSHQNGIHGLAKKRVNQPAVLALLSGPLPEYAMRALAMRWEDTRLSLSMSCART